MARLLEHSNPLVYKLIKITVMTICTWVKTMNSDALIPLFKAVYQHHFVNIIESIKKTINISSDLIALLLLFISFLSPILSQLTHLCCVNIVSTLIVHYVATMLSPVSYSHISVNSRSCWHNVSIQHFDNMP